MILENLQKKIRKQPPPLQRDPRSKYANFLKKFSNSYLFIYGESLNDRQKGVRLHKETIKNMWKLIIKKKKQKINLDP